MAHVTSSPDAHLPDARELAAQPTSSRPPDPWVGIASSLLSAVVATGTAWAVLGRQHLADVAMVYLLGTVLVSLRFGYGPSLLTAALSVVSFNYFFIPPYETFAVADPRHLVTFAVMVLVAALTSGLTQRIRHQAEEARRLAEDAHRAQREVESEQLRSALLSSVSHDLRTPLAVVTGAASTLLERELTAPVRRELTETILEEADRLNRLVQNLLDMTRLEAGSVRVRREWHSIEEIVGTALGRVETMLAGRPVVTALPSEGALVAIDALLVEQVLVNLLENAAKYTPAESPIEIAATLRDGAVSFAIADRGAGVPAEARDRIFEKFVRASSEPGGAGLGLAICKGIVTAHGGTIAVEERDGGGAVFRFSLPVEGEAPPITRELIPASERGRSS